MNSAPSTTIIFGNPQGDLAGIGMVMAVTSVLLFVVYGLITGLIKVRDQFRPIIGSYLMTLRWYWGMAIVLPVWLAAILCFYSGAMGGKFYEVRLRPGEGGGVCEFVYSYPTRVVRVPVDNVRRWYWQYDWSRRFSHYGFICETEDGEQYRSIPVRAHRFEEYRKLFNSQGISVQPPS